MSVESPEPTTGSTTFTINFESATNRRCGSCTLCCKLLPVPPLNKPANQRCVHQSSKGCRVYHRLDKGFPHECGLWSCQWLIEADTSSLHRPDRAGYVIDHMPDAVLIQDHEGGEKRQVMVIQIWADPARRDAWMNDQAFKDWLEDRAKRDHTAAIVRYNSRDAVVVFPPAISSDRKWHYEWSSTVVPRTGSMLMDEIIRK